MYIPEGNHQDSLACLRIFILVALPRVRRSWSRVNEHACRKRRVEASSVSASKTKRNRNTCVPRADSGTRAHALWLLWILFLFSSFSLFISTFLFSLSLSLSLLSFLFLSLSFMPFFFLYTRFYVYAFLVFTDRRNRVLLLVVNRHERSIRSLLVFDPILCDDRECKERFSSTW